MPSQKGAENWVSNLHKLNSRISPTRLFQKVWVGKQPMGDAQMRFKTRHRTPVTRPTGQILRVAVISSINQGVCVGFPVPRDELNSPLKRDTSHILRRNS
jgi:hypothetical protein